MKRFGESAAVLTLCAGAALSILPVSAYEVTPVPNGGTITGTVTLVGGIDARGGLEVTKDQTTCGNEVVDETLIVADGRIQNVVIAIEGITGGKEPAAATPHINNLNCRFVPHVQTMQKGTKLVIENADDILHNTHAIYEDGRTAFNLALPLQNQKIKKRIKRPGILSMQCDAGHTWMSAYVHVFDHPYHAATGENGSFAIADIPPGTYTLSVWHEKLANKKVEVTVEAGKTTDIAVKLEDTK